MAPEDQDGLLTRAQALTLGISDNALAHRVGPGGRWQRVLPRVYATFTGRLTEDQRRTAALLYAGPEAMLGGATVVALLGLRYGPTPARVHVLLPHWVRRRSTGFVVARRTTQALVPWRVGPWPVCPVAVAVIDAARSMRSLRAVRAMVCEVVQRRRTTPAALAAALAAGGSAGSALVRRAVADATAGCWSAPECELRDLLVRSRVLPSARWNVTLRDPAGRFLAVVDGRFDDVGLAVEVDSREHHLWGTSFEETLARHNRLEAAGIAVLHVSPQRLRREPMAVLREVEAAYLSRLAMIQGR
jgi:very-short-patch-repair endonuclease